MVSYDCCKKSKFLGDTHKNISSQGVYTFIKKKKQKKTNKQKKKNLDQG